MGQKVNPEIFKLKSFNTNWKSKYIETKPNELSTFFFKSLEIKKFIKRFLLLHGLMLHHYKIAISDTSLHLILSYFTSKTCAKRISRRHITERRIKARWKKKLKIKRDVTKLRKNLTKRYYNYIKTIKQKKKFKIDHQSENTKKIKFMNTFFNSIKKKNFL